jgi:hypothetical protein
MSDHIDTARALIAAMGVAATPGSTPCPGCGAIAPIVPDGPVHPSLGASAGCWALYGALLSREFGAFDAEAHRLSVDTYAAQHPGGPTPRGIQSTCTHLVALCLTLEHGWATDQIRPVMRDLARGRIFEPVWLSPPEGYRITLIHLLEATAPDAYAESVRQWARSTWEAWSAHHDQLRAWADVIARGHGHGQADESRLAGPG